MAEDPIAEYCMLWIRYKLWTQENQAGSELKVSSPASWLSQLWKVSCRLLWEESYRWFVLAVNPACYNTNSSGMVCLLAQSWQDCLGVTSCFLIESEACSMGGYSCLEL